MAFETTAMLMSINSILNPEAPTNQRRVSSTYWPTLRDTLLQDPSSYDNLDLECGICLDRMTIFQHEHIHSPEIHDLSHRARIFPCGHMFGCKCALAMIKDFVDNEQPIVCPICRVNFSIHRDCPHNHSGKPMPTNLEEICNFPPTLSEGGVVADKCGDCQVTDIVMGISCLAPMLLFPFEMEDREVLCVSAKTTGFWWDMRPSTNDYIAEDLPINEPLQRIIDEVKEKLSDNAAKSWCSKDLRGFELNIKLCKERKIGFVQLYRGYGNSNNYTITERY